MSSKSANDATTVVKDQPTIVYKVMKPEDSDEVLKMLLENFFPREALTLGLQMVGEDNLEWLKPALPGWIEGGVSVVARDKESDEMVGCRVSKILAKQDSAIFNVEVTNPKAKRILALLRHLEESVDLMKHFSVEKGLELAMNTVSPKYGRRGIGTRLVEESERLAQAKGCQFAAAQATSNFSQSYFKKLGYETLYELKYDGYLYKGEPLDTAKMAPHTSAKVMAKRLATK